MKNRGRSIPVAILFAAIFVLSCIIAPVKVFAAPMTLSVSRSTVNAGDSVTVTGRYKTDSLIDSFDGCLSFNENLFEYSSSSSSNGASVISSNGSAVVIKEYFNGAKSFYFSITFIAKNSGTGEFSLEGNTLFNDNIIDAITDSCAVTVAAVEVDKSKSSKYYSSSGSSSQGGLISEIKVSGAAIVPTFNPDVTAYTANVKYNIEKVTLSATVASGATVSGTGTFNVNIGNNTHTITVVSADKKTSKSYTVTVRRMTQQETADYEKLKAAENPLSVEVDGKTLIIASDVTPHGIFDGYVIEKNLRGDNEVTYLRDTKGKYRLYYLTDLYGNGKYYNLNSSGDFEDIKYLTYGDDLYIVFDIPNNIEKGEELEEVDVKIGDMYIPALRYKQKSSYNLYIIYCYNGGELGFYRLDGNDKSLSRAPEFAQEHYKEPANNMGIVKRFNNMSAAGKTVLILVVTVIMAVIVICVLYLVKRFKPNIQSSSTENSKLSEVEIIEEDIKTDNQKTDDF